MAKEPEIEPKENKLYFIKDEVSSYINSNIEKYKEKENKSEILIYKYSIRFILIKLKLKIHIKF